jgi:hypothetical protein
MGLAAAKPGSPAGGMLPKAVAAPSVADRGRWQSGDMGDPARRARGVTSPGGGTVANGVVPAVLWLPSGSAGSTAPAHRSNPGAVADWIFSDPEAE